MLLSNRLIDYKTEIDVWSAGMVFTEMILGRNLTGWCYGVDLIKRLATIFNLSSYKSPLTAKIKSQGLSEYLNDRSEVPLDPNLLDLLKRMMDVNPTTRISAEKALQHDYFSSFTPKLESGISVPHPKFLEPSTYDWTLKHPGLNKKMRNLLVDWLKDVADEYFCNVETYSQCIEIIDAFMTKTTEQIHKTDLQLIGVAAMLIASSMNELHNIEPDTLVELCGVGTYKEEQLTEMTWRIFNCIGHLMPRTRLTSEVIQRSSPEDLELICTKYCSSFPTCPM